ncbi:MAG: TldD/PmbA family protein [Candidatus Melainabacteria bacterium]|nr:TldD/PmbA family protein [Candidatus Melainabacteria bacterium]
MRELLFNTINKFKSQVDYLEIRLERKDGILISFQGPILDSITSSANFTGCVRAMHKSGWGFVSFNSLEDLHGKVLLAMRQSKLVGKINISFPKSNIKEAVVKTEIKKDPRKILLSEKKELFEHYNSLLLSYSNKIQSTQVAYKDEVKTTYFTNSLGVYIEQERLDVVGRFNVIACEGNVVKQAFESITSRGSYDEVLNLDKKVLETAERALRQLSAKPASGGTYTVVLDPRLTGVFIHEAFGHLSEGDNVYENERMKEILVLGKQIAMPQLTVVDSALIPNLPGTFVYDDEGVSANKTVLIENGILKNRLHSRETAAKMSEETTGNGRALTANFSPIPRMTNTYIDNGNVSFNEMISDIKEGIYALRMLGGQTNGELFTFSSGEAFMIRNGKIAEPVSDVTLSGNVFQTLNDIDAIGDDLTFTSGSCGKCGQNGLPVGVGGPHIRIKNVLVGGR